MFKKLFIFGGTAFSGIVIYDNFDISKRYKTALSLSFDPIAPIKKWNYNWDGLENNNSNKSKAIRHLILIRHGQYVYKEAESQCKLTLLGREQAQLTGIRLSELNITYDRLVHSTMTRATETANIIKKQNPTITMVNDPDLVEGTPYVNEPFLPHWVIPEDVIKVDNSRIEKAFRKYFYRAPPEQEKDSYEILVCHANVIRYMLCRALQFPPEGWIRFSLDHASISWVSIKPSGSISVRYIGNSGFMPPDKITVS